MSPKKVNTLRVWFTVLGCILMLFGFLLRMAVLFYAGFVLLLLALPLQIIFWRCPDCKTRLPEGIRKGRYAYRCTNCGKEIE